MTKIVIVRSAEAASEAQLSLAKRGGTRQSQVIPRDCFALRLAMTTENGIIHQTLSFPNDDTKASLNSAGEKESLTADPDGVIRTTLNAFIHLFSTPNTIA